MSDQRDPDNDPTVPSWIVPEKPARRVTPNPDRPMLPEALEQRFAPLDENSARTYDALEDAAALAHKVERMFDDGVIMVDLQASESLVHVVSAPPKKPPG